MTSDKKEVKFKVELVPEKIENKKQNILETVSMFATQLVNSKMPRKKILKRKHAFNPSVDNYFSPYVYIRIIDKIRDLS